ncbi:MAG TPA: hypothetical protein VHT75_16270 [Acidimicrobiales bacterium]|nr:hypothetical protein [Acidimicrobiales bacterium]
MQSERHFAPRRQLFLRRQLHLSPGRIGVLLGLSGVGGVVGAVVARRLAGRLGVGRVILWSMGRVIW